MKKLVIFCCLVGICLLFSNYIRPPQEEAPPPSSGEAAAISMHSEKESPMKISLKNQGKTLAFELNNSPAAQEFYDQLPLSIEIKDFSDNEKIFYPSKKLTTENTPIAYAVKGTLAYFAPWGNMTVFYKDYGQGTDLYEIGHILSGQEDLSDLSGTVEINKINE